MGTSTNWRDPTPDEAEKLCEAILARNKKEVLRILEDGPEVIWAIATEELKRADSEWFEDVLAELHEGEEEEY